MIIDPTSSISKHACIGHDVKIGPFCVIGSDVKLDNGVELMSHVVVHGNTIIGKNTKIYPFASIGHAPQDLKYKGEQSAVVIGNNNIIREYVTINSGTQAGGLVTSIGNNNLLMTGVHVAHDCVIRNHVILANYVSLAGHVTVDDYAIIGGLSAILQYVRIGRNSMIGGLSAVTKDVIPFGLVKNTRPTLYGINLIGARRHGFNNDEILESSNAINEIFSNDDQVFLHRLDHIARKYHNNFIVQSMIPFLFGDSRHGFLGIKDKK